MAIGSPSSKFLSGACGLVFLLASPACADDGTRPAIGDEAGRFSFVDIRYLSRALEDLGETRATVLLFLSRRCPVAQRYVPRMRELEGAFRERGIRFLGVFQRAEGSIVEMAAWGVDHEISFPVVQDRDGSVARAVGATSTPEAVVLDGERRIRYRGRIDGQYRSGGTSPEAGREDLREALEDLLASRDVAVAETEVDGCLLALAAAASSPEMAPTFARDVRPILARRCEGCHRSGGDAPFPLVSFEETRAMAAMIAEVVGTGQMPPWHADPRFGEFANARGITEDERETLIAWARGGASAGDLASIRDLEPDVDSDPGLGGAPEETAEWKISQPDLILEVPQEVEIPAQGYVPYKYAPLHPRGSPIPLVFTEDTWVQEIQILPRNPKVLHHANLLAIDPATRKDRGFLTGQVPGGVPMRIEPGIALKIEKGTVLVLQMHYVTTGAPETDRIRVGLVFPKERIARSLRHLVVADRDFEIPPGAPSHDVRAKRRLEKDSIGLGMFIHMHLRGRDMRFLAHYPAKSRPRAEGAEGNEDGAAATEDLLLVPNYSFDWQQSYVWQTGAKKFPAGTEIECIAHFDNSRFNPFNPDPAATVRFGQQTYEEMMYGFFFYVEEAENLGLDVDPATGRAK